MKDTEPELTTMRLMEMTTEIVTASATRDGTNVKNVVELIPHVAAALRKAEIADRQRSVE